MFDFLFGWRKASKCKKLIKTVQCRLKLLKSKRSSIVRQLREDVAQLIKIGYEDIAFNRTEQIFKDETIIAIYEQLESFCEFIFSHMKYIRKHKDCPNDINEAISSLIFASARCGDLPELRAIRKLFRDRYGQRFEKTALELLPGNLVNFQIQEKMSIQSVPDDVKQKLVEEIAKDYCLKPEILALEYTSELQQQEIEQISTSCSMVEQFSPEIMEPPEKNKEKKSGNGDLGFRESEIISKSSSENLSQILDEMIIYLDDVEEVQHSGMFQDQTSFKFKSSLKKSKNEDSLTEYSSSSSSSIGKVSRTVKRRADRIRRGTRRRKRSGSEENSFVKDIECVIYYEKPWKRSELEGSSDTEMEWYAFPDDKPRRKAEKIPYMRAMAMPQDRFLGKQTENVLRSKSFPIQSPNHVHPKLPDYDELAAKFMALKKEHLKNIQH